MQPVTTEAAMANNDTICPMTAEPQAEHHWLDRLVGAWTSEAECVMEPGQPPATFQGREVVRSLGGLWVVAEGTGDMPGGGKMTSILTLGYDPARQRYVGTFVASMMTHLWVYAGVLEGDVLTLDTEGPDFTTGGKTMARFKDAIEIVDADNRIMTSRMLCQDGQWRQFMIARYRRTS
jgi:hypothetical protein